MALILVYEPTDDVVTLAEVKEHLRIDTNDHDAVLRSYLRAARQLLDGVEGWLGRALAPQTYDLKLSGFPRCIRLPLPPLIEVISITYLDSNGDSQTLSTSVYTVVNQGYDVSYIEETINQNWPTTYDVAQAVTVRYRCGYVDGGSPEDVIVPEPIKEAIKLMVGHWYENREQTSMSRAAMRDIPLGADEVLSTYKVWSFA